MVELSRDELRSRELVTLPPPLPRVHRLPSLELLSRQQRAHDLFVLDSRRGVHVIEPREGGPRDRARPTPMRNSWLVEGAGSVTARVGGATDEVRACGINLVLERADLGRVHEVLALAGAGE